MIAYAGLSHLSMVSSICCASRGTPTVLFDTDESAIAALNAGDFPYYEPGLTELHQQAGSSFSATSNADALQQCDVIYIAKDVPTDENNRSDLRPISALIDIVLPHAKAGATVVVLSQLTPGFARTLNERFSELSQTLYYQVETLIFGRAVERALEPERYIVGCSDVSEELPTIYRELLESYDCPILKMAYESAELCKIAINMFLVSSVSTTNTIAELCEAIGANWNEIAPALRLDRRIGEHAYLNPGLGISGGNLERDLITFSRLAKKHGTNAEVVQSWLNNSEHRRDWVLRTIHQRVEVSSTRPRIAIWGLAYKTGTSSIKNSPSLDLINNLSDFDVCAHDPQVHLPEDQYPSVETANSPLEAVEKCDTLVVMTPWDEYKDIRIEELRGSMNGNTLIDPFQLFPAETCRNAGFEYFTLGRATREV